MSATATAVEIQNITKSTTSSSVRRQHSFLPGASTLKVQQILFCQVAMTTPSVMTTAVRIQHTCDISLFRRELPIFCLFLRKSPYENFQNFLFILYISLFRISDLPTKIQEFPSLFNHSPYLEKKISLFVFWDVSHVWDTKHDKQEPLQMAFGNKIGSCMELQLSTQTQH